MSQTKYPELYKDLIDKAAPRIVEKLGLNETQARAAVHIVTEVIRTDWSGSNLYLSKGISFELTGRDRQIFAEFTGANHEVLARKNDMTVRRVYQIIEAVGREEFLRRQTAFNF